MKRLHMTRIVNRRRYDTKSATLIADDVYWDGHNFERHGRNSWLYRTPGGAFFTVTATQWQGEQDRLDPVDMDEAIRLYEETLTEHYLEYTEAFGIVPSEPEGPGPKSPGRPARYDGPMEQTGIMLPRHIKEWLAARPDGIAETIRQLVQQAMDNERP